MISIQQKLQDDPHEAISMLKKWDIGEIELTSTYGIPKILLKSILKENRINVISIGTTLYMLENRLDYKPNFMMLNMLFVLQFLKTPLILKTKM